MMARALTANTVLRSTTAMPYGSAFGTSGTCVEIVNRCIDSAMHWSNKPYAKRWPSLMALKNTAPVNMIGAVSPAARDTCRITPVRMPLIELGRTMYRIVCQRVAPTFQHASRNAIGTAARASLGLAIMTGSVVLARVSDAARMDFT